MHRRRFIALFFTALLSVASVSAETPPRVVRVLFIRNSYTYGNDLPALVAQLPRNTSSDHLTK